MIKMRLIIILFLVMLSIPEYAQEKFRASLSMGQVYPLGKFSSVDATSDQSGYAQTGFMLNIDGDYQVHNRLAFTMRFNFGNSSIDWSAFSERLYLELSDYILATDTVNYDINYWQWASPMVGLKYNYPIVINKAYVEFGVFSGINFVQIPDQNLFFDDQKNKRVIVSQNIGNTNYTIPFAVSGGLRYRLNSKMQLKVNAEYFYSKTKIEHVAFYQFDNSVEPVDIEKYTFKVPIQTLNVSVGLVYNF